MIEDTTKLAHNLVNETAVIIDQASEAERLILKCRLLQKPPATLSEIGSQMGVSRERIRQIQARVETTIRNLLDVDVRAIAAEFKKRFGHLALQEEVERQFEALMPAERSFATDIVCNAIHQELGFKLKDGVYFDASIAQELKNFRQALSKLTDDVGLVNERQVREVLQSESLQRVWPWVCTQVRLHRLYGTLSLRNTKRAKVKAALLSIGRPATKSEIENVCEIKSGQLSSHLSNIPSVVRADKERWGLNEWIEEKYEGVVKAIIRRIEMDGGSTSTKLLVKELPLKFNILAHSVQSYMQTAKFDIRNGRISIADPSSLQLRDLDEVIDGRDEKGNPYCTFIVQSRLFRGYSILGVAPEFADALGCKPDGSARVRIENLAQYQLELSINWPLASNTGASIGHIAEPLRRLEIVTGDRVRITIKKPHLVALHADVW